LANALQALELRREDVGRLRKLDLRKQVAAGRVRILFTVRFGG